MLQYEFYTTLIFWGYQNQRIICTGVFDYWKIQQMSKLKKKEKRINKRNNFQSILQ
jgi:hypothetical protein